MDRARFPQHDSVWQAPSPLWGGARERTLRPALLRFADDDFMERIAAILAQPDSAARSAALETLQARGESWRDGVPATPSPAPAATPLARRLAARIGKPMRRSAAAEATPSHKAAPAVERPLKLFQPAHQRFYLIAASLVCGTPGLPDRALNSTMKESVRFVVRRLLPTAANKDAAFAKPAQAAYDPQQWQEYAWVSGPQGMRWAAADDTTLAAGEDLLPLFPMAWREEGPSGERPRRMWAGLVPVGKREAYLGGAIDEATTAPAPAANAVDDDDARLTLLRKTVTGPWRQLIEQGWAHYNSHERSSPVADQVFLDNEEGRATVARRRLREAMQTSTWYVLADFAKWLVEELPEVWKAVLARAGGTPLPALSTAEDAFFDALDAARVDVSLFGSLTQAVGEAYQAQPEGLSYDNAKSVQQNAQRLFAMPDNLCAALVAARNASAALEAARGVFGWTGIAARRGWPGFLFPLADGIVPTGAPMPLPLVEQDAAFFITPADRRHFRALNRLVELAAAALPAAPDRPKLLSVAPPPRLDVENWFVIRCVLTRPDCFKHGPTISAPTEAFQLASFFDPDAPARPIRIGLPVDTSSAGLRKFDKNTAFVMSDLLCGQVARAKGLGLVDLVRSVLPWPLHKDLDVGDMGPCSKNDSNQLGMICSLSIPIITLCALILLLVMVSLLDFIFRWMPFFAICFPILKKKGGGS
ncbi:hypothetical protein OPU71_20395 [Niveibacterium sp. 24ML]|uniref:hypothetical protein n=1 Tax=Niveibacterium sp. 24ML TaxID=2985512 RepID=UPI002271DD55|nr:hypothetical protein [Niveibacterium sp. 24ML]MCX9158489.1 hypothetical protein [Niveibacterium sp. 24ML]